MQHGARVEADFHLLMAKRLTHTGSTLRVRPVAFKASVAAGLHENVWPLFEKRAVAPVIDSKYPLLRAADAHAHMEGPSHFGKIVLTVVS
jgi:NADPH:quinone reductase-like Zn-dependent oxidoreductase